MLTRLTSVSALAASLALVACGGGDDDMPPPPAPAPAPAPAPPPAPTAVPDSAIASTTSFVAYLNGQSFTDETSEALTLPAGDAPTSETEEPKTL